MPNSLKEINETVHKMPIEHNLKHYILHLIDIAFTLGQIHQIKRLQRKIKRIEKLKKEEVK